MKWLSKLNNEMCLIKVTKKKKRVTKKWNGKVLTWSRRTYLCLVLLSVVHYCKKKRLLKSIA